MNDSRIELDARSERLGRDVSRGAVLRRVAGLAHAGRPAPLEVRRHLRSGTR
jgi:hypothetical protein